MMHSIHMHDDAAARHTFLSAMQCGLILNYSGYGSSVKLSFPLNIESNLIDAAFDKLNQALITNTME